MKLKLVGVLLIAALLAVLVVRVALLEARLPSDPIKAAEAWPSHPSAIMASGLAELGQAAAGRRGASRQVIERIISEAANAPLVPEPFLVRGVDATLGGRFDLAERSFSMARDRDPRSVPARYFLADHYLKTGQVEQGLAEISALTRLVPGSLGSIGPYLAAYARDPKGSDEVRQLLRRNPQLEPIVLNELATNADNASLAMSLWNGKAGNRIQPWQQKLLETLIATGQFHRAHATWLQFAGKSEEQDELAKGFDERGRGVFSWALASDPSGVVEVEENGTARVTYYGRDELVLAQRVFVLGPGRHTMAMKTTAISGSSGSLAWTVRCLPSGLEIARHALPKLATDRLVAFSFEVPNRRCEAQRIVLAGTPPEIQERAEVAIASFQIESAGDK